MSTLKLKIIYYFKIWDILEEKNAQTKFDGHENNFFLKNLMVIELWFSMAIFMTVSCTYHVHTQTHTDTYPLNRYFKTIRIHCERWVSFLMKWEILSVFDYSLNGNFLSYRAVCFFKKIQTLENLLTTFSSQSVSDKVRVKFDLSFFIYHSRFT